ncbi:holo-[acyl-carrier-protein] synthase, partial [Candidatus Saccharibacteria bacterium]|nr:holo-[acyl-carrier-protein] synthase [Candidatus Saccharibacteria bacterium]NIW80133.1 holo-[acyl-carrier-protein] synthase [Calditrichia bacterium]
AARFATKEAVFKATGIGLSMGMRWRDVEVVNDKRGKPSVRLYGITAEKLQGKKVHLSISHSRNLAIAVVMVEDG